MVGFSSASLFPARKWEADTQGGTRVIGHSTRRITQRAGLVKRYRCILDTFIDTFPGRGGYKNHCGRMEPSDYINFRKAVNIQWFRTLNTYDTALKTKQKTIFLTNALHVGTRYMSVPTRCRSFPPQ